MANTQYQLKSLNQHSLIASKQILSTSHQSFHEDITSLSLAFRKLKTLLLPLKTKHIPVHPSPIKPTANHIYDNHGTKLALDHLLQTDSKKWNQALSNKFGRLTQSNYKNVCCTDTMDLIHPSEIPSNEKITNASFVCDHQPLKLEKWRTRLVIGGNKLPYYDDTGSPAANLIKN